jgi:universal stress protein E
MTPIRRILVVLDPALQWTPALKKAIALGRTLRAELWLGLFDRGPRLGLIGMMDREEAQRLERMMREQVGTRLQDLAKSVRETSGMVVHTIDEAVPLEAERVTAEVVRHEIDLVVKDVHHESTVRRMLFVPIDWDLLRTCPVPLWLAGNARDELPLRIGAAVDPVHVAHGAALNPAILDSAQALALACGARLRVFTCFGGFGAAMIPMEPTGIGIPFSTEVLYDALRTEHEAAFHRLLDTRGVARERGVILQGSITESLTSAVRDTDTDLLVLGVVRRHGVQRALMGSTAERLVDRAPCDIFAVPANVEQAEEHAAAEAQAA